MKKIFISLLIALVITNLLGQQTDPNGENWNGNNKIIEFPRFEPQEEGVVFKDLRLKVLVKFMSSSYDKNDIIIQVSFESGKVLGYKYKGHIYSKNPRTNNDWYESFGIYLGGTITKHEKEYDQFNNKLLLIPKAKWVFTEEISNKIDPNIFWIDDLKIIDTKHKRFRLDIQNHFKENPSSTSNESQNSEDKNNTHGNVQSSIPSTESGFDKNEPQNQNDYPDKNDKFIKESHRKAKESQKVANKKIDEFNQYAEDYSNHWQEQKEKNEALKKEKQRQAEENRRLASEKRERDIKEIKETINECEEINENIKNLISSNSAVSTLKGKMKRGNFSDGENIFFSFVLVESPIYWGVDDLVYGFNGIDLSFYEGEVNIYTTPGVFIVNEYTKKNYQKIIGEFDFKKDDFSKVQGHSICSSSKEDLKAFLKSLNFHPKSNIIQNKISSSLALRRRIDDSRLRNAFFEDLNYRSQLHENTPLHEAADAGNLKEIKRLLQKGADINSTNKWGSTPLLVATCNGHLEIVKYLIKNKADTELAGEFRAQGPFTPYEAARHFEVNNVLMFFENLFNEEELKKEVQKADQNNKNKQEYEFKIKIIGLEDKVVYLTKNYGKKSYFADTTVADSEGNIYFASAFQKKGGNYKILGPEGDFIFDFLINNEDINLETSLEDPYGDAKIIQSKENKVFFEWVRYLRKVRIESEEINQKLKRESDYERREALQESLTSINDKVDRKRDEMIKMNPDLLISDVLNAQNPIDIPEGSESEKREYYIDHFWDNVNLSNGDLVRTPIVQFKLDEYYSLIKNHEKSTHLIDRVISQESIDSEVKDFIIKKTLNLSWEFRPIFASHTLWAHLVLTYINQVDDKLISKNDKSRLTKRAKRIQPFLKDEKFPFNHSPELKKVKGKMQLSQFNYALIVMHDKRYYEYSYDSRDLSDIVDVASQYGIQVFSFNWSAYHKKDDYNFEKIRVSKESGEKYEDLFIASNQIFLIDNNTGAILASIRNLNINKVDEKDWKNIFISCIK